MLLQITNLSFVKKKNLTVLSDLYLRRKFSFYLMYNYFYIIFILNTVILITVKIVPIIIMIIHW